MGQELRTAETVLAIIGAVLWAILPIPQIVKSFRLKSTAGLSPLLMLIWAIGGLFISVYAIVRSLSLALIIEPHVFGIFAAVSWCQCLYYDSGLSLRASFGACGAFLGLWAFIEVTSIFALKYAQEHSTELPVLMYGYASSVLTIVGLIPQYVEIYRLKQVVGISFVFLWVGIMGGFFMFASLCCREKLDYAAAAVYLSTSMLNFIIWVLALILNPRAKRQGISLSQLPRGKGAGANAAGADPIGAGQIDMEAIVGTLPVLTSTGGADLPPHPSSSTDGSGTGKKNVELSLPLPAPRFMQDASAPNGYKYAYDDSPPVTPLETPGEYSTATLGEYAYGGYALAEAGPGTGTETGQGLGIGPGEARDSYFSSATLAGDVADKIMQGEAEQEAVPVEVGMRADDATPTGPGLGGADEVRVRDEDDEDERVAEMVAYGQEEKKDEA